MQTQRKRSPGFFDHTSMDIEDAAQLPFGLLRARLRITVPTDSKENNLTGKNTGKSNTEPKSSPAKMNRKT